MKKLLLSISFIVCFFAGFSQSIVNRSTGANTLNDPNLFTSKSFRPPVFADTTAANAVVSLDSCGKVIFTYDVMALWTRACSPKRWERVGGSMSFESSSSITFSGTGSSTVPIVADVNVSTQSGNVIQSTGQGLYVPMFVQDGIIEPGVITWVGNYDYDVSPAVGVIGGVRYTSDWTPITLATADPTFDRIDLVVFNAGGTISVITGTPAADPQQPVLDPATQLEMAFILVTANTTAPPVPPTQDWIYQNYITNAWTTASSNARINDQSLVTPYSVPTVVRAIAAENLDNIRFTASAPPTITDFNVITLKIRAASIWVADSRIGLQWYSGATPVGSEVAIANESFGFTSTNISTYQIVSIPLYTFGSLASVTNLLITVRSTGGRTISFFIDDIQLQDGVVPLIAYTASNGLKMVGSDIRLGGFLTAPTSIVTGGHNLTFSGGNSGSMLAITNSSNIGITSTSVNGAGMNAVNSSTVVNTVETALKITRSIAATPSAGIGAAAEFMISPATSFTPLRSNRLISEWTDEGIATRTAKFTITGVSNAVESNLFELSGDGALRLNKYLLNAFPGTAVNNLAIDASGNVITVATGGGGIAGITADNGLTANTSTNVQLGGTLLQNTSIASSTFTLAISGAPSTAFANLFSVTNTSTTGSAIYATSPGLNATIQAINTKTTAFGGWAFFGTSTGGAPTMYLQRDSSATNTVISLAQVERRTSGTAANGIGASIEFSIEAAGGTTGLVSNSLISKLTNATEITRTSQFIITGVNSGTLGDILTLNGNKSIQANGYGISTFTGTPATYAAFDATGNIIEVSGIGSGPVITADNGLTKNSATNVQLGGTLLANTTLTGGAFKLIGTSTVTGSQGVWEVSNTSSGHGFIGVAVSGSGVFGSSTSGNGILGQSTSGNGVNGSSTNGFGASFTSTNSLGLSAVSSATAGVLAGTTLAGTNDVGDVVIVRRNVAGAGVAAVGLGASIRYEIENDAGATEQAGALMYKWSNATTPVADFEVHVTNNSSTKQMSLLGSTGQLVIHAYGTGAITAGAAAFGLAVDANGNVIEIALGGGGGGTVNSVAGTLNRITSTGGTDPIIDISASYVGQTSITILGTIATGVWNGTAIGDTYISSATTWNAKQTGDATLTALAGLTITNGSIIYGTGADAFVVLAGGTNGQVLTMSGSVPAWVTLGTGGTVSNITGVTANGFAWSIANPTTTPALTLSVSITGMLKGNGTAISAAVAGTDYLTPTGSAALLTSFPTFNQNTTGSAATLTTSRNINGVAFNGSADITITSAAGTLTGTTLNATVVNSSLTSVGTITTGTWQGTAIGLGFGGTGLTSGGTANQLLGMNAAGNASQYKTFSSSNGITITHSVGGVAFANTFNPTPQTLADGATITWNVASGGNAKVTLAGTGRTLSIPAPVAGYTYTIEITQGSGGSKTITTWPTGTTWSGSNTLSTTAGDVDVVVFYYSGTGYRAVMTTDYD